MVIPEKRISNRVNNCATINLFGIYWIELIWAIFSLGVASRPQQTVPSQFFSSGISGNAPLDRKW
jgi:hypothetical protein